MAQMRTRQVEQRAPFIERGEGEYDVGFERGVENRRQRRAAPDGNESKARAFGRGEQHQTNGVVGDVCGCAGEQPCRRQAAARAG